MRGIVSDILSTIGLAPAILRAIADAELDPTSANINAVIAAYAANGQTPPAQLIGHLIQINSERHPEDPYVAGMAGNILPWLLLGGAALALFMRRGRR